MSAQVESGHVWTVAQLHDYLEKCIRAGHSNALVVVQETRPDVPRALARAEYACTIKVKPAEEHGGVFVRTDSNESSKDAVLIAYV